MLFLKKIRLLRRHHRLVFHVYLRRQGGAGVRKVGHVFESMLLLFLLLLLSVFIRDARQMRPDAKRRGSRKYRTRPFVYPPAWPNHFSFRDASTREVSPLLRRRVRSSQNLPTNKKNADTRGALVLVLET